MMLDQGPEMGLLSRWSILVCYQSRATKVWMTFEDQWRVFPNSLVACSGARSVQHVFHCAKMIVFFGTSKPRV